MHKWRAPAGLAFATLLQTVQHASMAALYLSLGSHLSSQLWVMNSL